MGSGSEQQRQARQLGQLPHDQQQKPAAASSRASGGSIFSSKKKKLTGGREELRVVGEAALVAAVARAALEVEADARRALLLLARGLGGALLADVHARARVAEAAGAALVVAALLAGDVAAAVRAEARVVLAVREAARVAAGAAALVAEGEALAGGASLRRDRLALGVLVLAVVAVAARAIVAEHAADLDSKDKGTDEQQQGSGFLR